MDNHSITKYIKPPDEKIVENVSTTIEETKIEPLKLQKNLEVHVGCSLGLKVPSPKVRYARLTS